MVQQAPVIHPPQCPPQPARAPGTPPPQYWPEAAPQPRQQWGPPRGGRGGFRGRGRGRGAFQPPPPQQSGCFVCGLTDILPPLCGVQAVSGYGKRHFGQKRSLYPVQPRRWDEYVADFRCYWPPIIHQEPKGYGQTSIGH